VNVEVDLPATEGSEAAAGSPTVHLAIFLPDIPDCDWNVEDGATVAPNGTIASDALPSKCEVPVVADVGLY
jgi:hypothetical protein